MILWRMGTPVPIIGKETTVFSFQFTLNGKLLALLQGLCIGVGPYVAVQGHRLTGWDCGNSSLPSHRSVFPPQ